MIPLIYHRFRHIVILQAEGAAADVGYFRSGVVFILQAEACILQAEGAAADVGYFRSGVIIAYDDDSGEELSAGIQVMG
jgi:hypothetical protein